MHLVVEVVHTTSGLIIAKGSASFRMAESGEIEFPMPSELNSFGSDHDNDGEEEEEEEESGVGLMNQLINQRPFTANSCYLIEIAANPQQD